jgi:hypothetical protein
LSSTSNFIAVPRQRSSCSRAIQSLRLLRKWLQSGLLVTTGLPASTSTRSHRILGLVSSTRGYWIPHLRCEYIWIPTHLPPHGPELVKFAAPFSQKCAQVWSILSPDEGRRIFPASSLPIQKYPSRQGDGEAQLRGDLSQIHCWTLLAAEEACGSPRTGCHVWADVV